MFPEKQERKSEVSAMCLRPEGGQFWNLRPVREGISFEGPQTRAPPPLNSPQLPVCPGQVVRRKKKTRERES